MIIITVNTRRTENKPPDVSRTDTGYEVMKDFFGEEGVV